MFDDDVVVDGFDEASDGVAVGEDDEILIGI